MFAHEWIRNVGIESLRAVNHSSRALVQATSRFDSNNKKKAGGRRIHYLLLQSTSRNGNVAWFCFVDNKGVVFVDLSAAGVLRNLFKIMVNKLSQKSINAILLIYTCVCVCVCNIRIYNMFMHIYLSIACTKTKTG